MAKASKNRHKIEMRGRAPPESRSSRRLVGTGATRTRKGQPINKLQLKLATILCAVLCAPFSRADIQLSAVGIRATESVNNVSGAHQHGVLLRFQVNSQSRRFWIPSSLDLTVGALESGADAGSFISFGPSYRFDMSKREAGRWFVDFGVHPTWLTRTEFGGRELGGNFHFTSHLGLGAYLGQQKKTSILLRYQHTSNAGIDSPNPGLDMFGVAFSYYFGADPGLLSAEVADQN